MTASGHELICDGPKFDRGICKRLTDYIANKSVAQSEVDSLRRNGARTFRGHNSGIHLSHFAFYVPQVSVTQFRYAYVELWTYNSNSISYFAT